MMKKRIVVAILGFCFAIFTCSTKEETFKLKEGTPAYDLARDLVKTIPELDPQKSLVVISTKYFDVNTAEVIFTLQENFGTRTQQLLSMPAEQLKNIIMENARGLTEKKLILRAAGQAGVTVSQAEQDSLLNLQYNRYGGEQRYKELLAQNNLDVEFVKKDLRNGLIIQHYFENNVKKGIEISEEEIQQSYQKDFLQDKYASVRHILLLTGNKSESEKAAQRQKMESIRQQALKGDDFAELAKKYTEDPGSKGNGGLYENFERGSMVKPFDDASFSLPIGEISDIIETQYGYHILKVIDRKKAGGNLEEMRGKIVDQLRKQKEEAAFKSHLEQLKTEGEYKQIGL
jgi:parvulin-like peptidyl-prolyl isomerase